MDSSPPSAKARSLTLAAIYRPIRKDLPGLARALRRELSHDKGLLSDIGQHLLGASGKRLRPALVLLSGRAGGQRHRGLIDLACAVEMIHVATLVHDDVIDNASLRRRKASVNSRWGNNASVIMGDYLYARAFSLLTELDKPAVLKELSDTAVRMCEGEMLQIGKAFDTRIEEEEYFEIIEKKTASLIRAAATTGALLTEARPRTVAILAQYSRRLGLAFQIIDDCLDFDGTQAEFGKAVHADLKKGKLTLPIIMLLRSGRPQARRELERALSASRDGFRNLQRLIHEQGTLERSYAVAARFATDAKKTCRRLGVPSVEKSLVALCDYVLARRS